MPLYMCYGIYGLIIFLLHSYLKERHSALSKVPGPWLAAWTRLWLVSSLVSGEAGDIFFTLDQRYGPVVRTGPNNILVSDPEATRKILADGSRYTRGPWFDTLRLDPLRTNVISERDPKKHHDLRYVLGNAVCPQPGII
ncbi:hypothetical protein P154DRAFT_450165 [Amniculicola lignicola CBS 123094]|uniref:Cytochrome P450 n=1 Tax=Amniculicola lignicola CBS 123094 TaxID=1392246 RepID=A0A6A5W729_9PLEO|nr:hypothetical protein P154DRAFT_450165 [Amniculicola lignicola CBS 123094]